MLTSFVSVGLLQFFIIFYVLFLCYNWGVVQKFDLLGFDFTPRSKKKRDKYKSANLTTSKDGDLNFSFLKLFCFFVFVFVFFVFLFYLIFQCPKIGFQIYQYRGAILDII